MALLLASTPVAHTTSTAYPVLLIAAASLGVGFGLTVPSVNTFTAAFHPTRVDGSILTLNALLSLGTALARALIAVFVGLGFGWGLPLLAAAMTVVVLLERLRLPLRVTLVAAHGVRRRGISPRFWISAAFALIYGICETMNGNWSQIDMTHWVGSSAAAASLALATFWAMVTLGRVLFAVLQRWFPSSRADHLLPVVLAGALLLIARLPHGSVGLGLVAFGLAGLGCSALLPLTISCGQQELIALSTAVAGGIIARYPMGDGIAAFGVGPITSSGVPLNAIVGLAAGAALVLGGLSFVVAGRHPAPAALHPRPAA